MAFGLRARTVFTLAVRMFTLRRNASSLSRAYARVYDTCPPKKKITPPEALR